MSDKIREEFEESLKKKQREGVISDRFSTAKSGGCYIDDAVDDMFIMWQESRAALVVELPETTAVYASQEYNSTILDVYYDSDIKDMLDKAGIKYE